MGSNPGAIKLFLSHLLKCPGIVVEFADQIIASCVTHLLSHALVLVADQK